MRDNAQTIFAADSLGNTMFSVHMYEVYNTATAVQNYLTSFQAKGHALIVGEFGTENNGNNVDEASILQYTQQMGIGYMGWSWSGNGGCCAALDIAINFDPANLSTWGNFLINSANGIKATSKLATNFGGTASSSSVKSSSSSVRSSSSSIALSSSSSLRSSSSSSIVSSSKSSASSSSSTTTGEQCNWYGTLYPLCKNTSSGWGYENNKSCIARSTCATQPAPYGVVGSATSSSVASSSGQSSSLASSVSSSTVVSSSSASSVANAGLSCVYVVTNSWGGGYQGAIRVTNKGSNTINGWTATWQYAGANRLTSSWNATVTGANPYSATSLSRNGSLAAGQTVEFGIQGNTNGSAVETPAISCK
jgi:mannan endo-1,4-beta-mannosidase